MQEEHSELMSLSSSVESEECPLAYLETVHQLRERVNALIQTPLPEVPSLHVAPRAERFLEEHWSDVTIRGLRDAPVPQISCHTLSCSTAGAQAADGARLRRLPSPPAVVMIMLLMLVLTALCLHSACGSALGFSALFHAVENVSSELTQPLHEMGTFFCCLLQNISTKLNAFISSFGENAYQHLLSFLKTLH